MPTMTTYISPRGTPLSEGGQSAVGHMFYTLTDSNGTVYSYGFAPTNHGDPFGPGTVYTNDIQNYSTYTHKREFPISEAQFQDVLAWSELRKFTGDYGDYSGIGNNCITFTFDAMKAGGFNPTFTPTFHDWWPTWNQSNVDDVFFDYMRRAEFNREFRSNFDSSGSLYDRMARSVSDYFQQAIGWQAPPRPPRP